MKIKELYADCEVPQIGDIVQFEPQYRKMKDIMSFLRYVPDRPNESIDRYFDNFCVKVQGLRTRTNEYFLHLYSIEPNSFDGRYYEMPLPAFIFRKVKT